MLTKRKQLDQKGFTIIEVLIVLAIAGLILLIVFLAVPALQRNSRNTQRKSDASALLSAFSEYVNNNDGNLPASCTGNDCEFYSNAKLGYYKDATKIKFVNGDTAGANPSTDAESIRVSSGLKCTGDKGTTAAGTSRNIVVLYAVERGSSSLQPQCVASGT